MFDWRYARVRRTTLLMVWAGAFLLGLAGPRVGIISGDATWLIVGSLLLVLCVKKWWLVAVPAVVLSGLLIGLWRGSQLELSLQRYQPLLSQKVVMEGVVRDDPTYNDKSQLELRLGDLDVGGQHMPGVLRLTTVNNIQPQRGDRVRAQGTLRDGFGNYQAAIYFANVSVVQKQVSWTEQLRHLFTASILSNLPEPQASLGLGFLIGLKSQLPDDLGEQLKVLGLTHIVVASGYNLTILVRLGRRLFARRSKYQALLFSVILMAGFVAMTGFSASMSRAALVTSLALAAWYCGRRVHPLLLILIAAAITAAINPLYLWSDIGWWLSFLAFGGVLLGAPLLQRRFFGDKQPHWLVQIFMETLCAQLFTLPLILWLFGDLSVLSLLANLLVVPLIPVVMLLTFIAGVAGMVVPAIAAWVALPAIWLLTYLTEVIALLSLIPWASVAMSISAMGMLVLYGLLLAVGMIMVKKTKHSFLSSSPIE